MWEMSRFESEQVAQLPVQAHNRLERDGIAVFVEDVRGQGGIRRGHSGPADDTAGVHLGLYCSYFHNGVILFERKSETLEYMTQCTR